MSIPGVPLALGFVSTLAVGAWFSPRGSASHDEDMREIVFDGITLVVPEELANRSERAWWNRVEIYLPDHASDVPRRAHYRTLANRLQVAARRAKAKNQSEADEKARMEADARWLTQLADAADSVRGGRLPGKERELHPGDQVRARGNLGLKGITDGTAYVVHLTPTKSGAPMVTFRVVDALGRPSRHEVGPFRMGAVESFLKPADYAGPGARFILESIAPGDLEG
jgi:hypothetical protein